MTSCCGSRFEAQALRALPNMTSSTREIPAIVRLESRAAVNLSRQTKVGLGNGCALLDIASTRRRNDGASRWRTCPLAAILAPLPVLHPHERHTPTNEAPFNHRASQLSLVIDVQPVRQCEEGGNDRWSYYAKHCYSGLLKDRRKSYLCPIDRCIQQLCSSPRFCETASFQVAQSPTYQT